MDISILNIVITLINLLIIIAIPIGIIIFIVKIIKNQKKMKLDIESLNKQLKELENK